MRLDSSTGVVPSSFVRKAGMPIFTSNFVHPPNLFVRMPRPTDQMRPTLCQLKKGLTLPPLSRQSGSAARQVRLRTLLFVSRPGWEPLGRRLACGSRTVDDWRPGENLSSSSVEVSQHSANLVQRWHKNHARIHFGFTSCTRTMHVRERPSSSSPCCPGAFWAGVRRLPLREGGQRLPAATISLRCPSPLCPCLATVSFDCAVVCDGCAIEVLFPKASKALQLDDR